MTDPSPTTTTFSLEIDNTAVQSVIKALCYFGGFFGTNEDGSSQITSSNAKQAVINWIIGQVASYQAAMQPPPPPPPAPLPPTLFS